MQQVVTFTGFEEKKRGENKRGPWALRVFTAAGGTKFQTFDVALGDQLVGLVNSPVEVEYEIEDNGNFQNNVIKAAKAVNGTRVDVDLTKGPGPVVEFQPPSKDRELRIMRQSALDRAISTVAAGVVTVTDPHQLFAIADQYIRYFEGGSEAFTTDNIKF